MARKTNGDPIIDKLAKRKNMTGYELRSQRSTPKKASEPTGNVTPRRGVKVEGPDKDYYGKRNIWGQEKNKVTTRTKETDKRGKVTEKKIVTKTRNISPKRTTVSRTGSVDKPASSDEYNPLFRPGGKVVQEGKAKTIRTKRVEKFLAKHKDYTVGDRNLKTKTKTETKTYKPGSPSVNTSTNKKTKKGRVAVARSYQAKTIPRKIVQSLPHIVLSALITQGSRGKYLLKQ